MALSIYNLHRVQEVFTDSWHNECFFFNHVPFQRVCKLPQEHIELLQQPVHHSGWLRTQHPSDKQEITGALHRGKGHFDISEILFLK
jgi:hypothetical protein